jgi:hypothetical protein
MKQLIFLLIIFLNSPFSAQEDISLVPYLTRIEQGDAVKVKEEIPDLKKQYPGAPSLLYLEAILTEDALLAVKMFTALLDKYPASAYADAATFRLYSYFSALDNSANAKKYESRLLSDYPYSPYSKMIKRSNDNPVNEVGEFKFTIQAGAFASITNADALRKKFEKAGYYSVIKDKTVGGTIFKIVYAGRFNTKKEAENFQAILNKQYGLKGIITGYIE